MLPSLEKSKFKPKKPSYFKIRKSEVQSSGSVESMESKDDVHELRYVNSPNARYDLTPIQQEEGQDPDLMELVDQKTIDHLVRKKKKLELDKAIKNMQISTE